MTIGKIKVSWVNPEKLIIQEKIDFSDSKRNIKEQLTKLVSISKIEQFAILKNENLDKIKREELEKLSFIERIPLGIYHFSILNHSEEKGEIEKSCEILVYSNIEQSYIDFINALEDFFKEHNLTERDNLTKSELIKFSEIIDLSLIHI